MKEVVFRQSWLKIFFLAISASALAGFLTAVLVLPSKNGYLLFDSNISVIEKMFLVIGTIVFDFLASSQFFSQRKTRKPPAKLVAAKALSFHFFFLV